MLTPVTYRVVGESHIVLSLDTGRVYGPDLVKILTERSSMCVKDGIRRCREQVHRHRGRSRRPSGSPGCQRRPDAVSPRLSVVAAVSRSGIMGTGRNDLRGFQPDRRAGSRCGPPVRPPAYTLQVMGLMINRFTVLQNIRIDSLKYDVIKVDRKGHINA